MERTAAKSSTGALAGLRALEMAEGVAAPVAAMLLADHGADVVKIERAEGDFARSHAGFAAWNRGKKSVVVNPASAADREWLCAQIRGADVCIVGANDAIAASHPQLTSTMNEHAGLVLARFPAYLASRAGWHGDQDSHGLLAATGGLGWRQSSNDGGPVDPISKFINYGQALWGAACILAALYERGVDGHGQQIVVTGMNALMQALIHPYSVDPHAPDPATNIGSFGRHPTYRPYEASDGKWIASGALGPKFEVELLALLGISDVLEDPRIAGDVDRMKNPKYLDWVMSRVSAAFKKRPRDEWIELMMAAGIPCGPINSREELLDHPQVAAIGMRIEVEDAERGTVTMPGIPTNLMRSPGRVAGPAPRLGEHTGLKAWSSRPAPSRPRSYRTGALSGLKVLNLGTFVATPYAGFLLSELGADVVKVEPLAGDPFRTNGYPHNRGMRSLAIDLTKAAGLTAFKRLTVGADIIIDGMRPGVMRKLGLDHGALTQERSDVITLSLSGFGEHGPLASLPGFDMVMQGFSGIMTAQGAGSEPVASTVAYVDATTACMNVFGCMLALIHRQKTGEGQHVWNSLLGTAAYLQLAELTRFAQRPAPRQGSPDFRGCEWFDRYYQSTDGWVRIDASNDTAAARLTLRRAGWISSSEHDETLTSQLATRIGALTTENAVRALNELGVPAVRTRRVSELFTDPDLMMSEFAHLTRAVDGSMMSIPGRYASFSRTQRWGPLRPPGLGEHTQAVLQEGGLSTQEIARLMESEVIRQGGPMVTRFGATYR